VAVVAGEGLGVSESGIQNDSQSSVPGREGAMAPAPAWAKAGAPIGAALVLRAGEALRAGATARCSTLRGAGRAALAVADAVAWELASEPEPEVWNTPTACTSCSAWKRMLSAAAALSSTSAAFCCVA
jgi:hypothetical protein